MLNKLAFALILTVLCDASVSTQASDKLVLRSKTFQDPGMGNMPSHTMLVPQGWTAEGSGWWPNPNMFNNPPSQHITLTAPDGTTLEVGPSLMARDYLPSGEATAYGARRAPEMQIDNGMVVLYRPNDFQQWRTFYEQKVIPQLDQNMTDVRLVEVVEIPVLTQLLSRMLQPLQQQIEQGNQMNRQMGFEQLLEVGGLAFSLEYSQNGKRFERLHLLGIMSTTTSGPMGQQICWGTMMDVAYSAPQGQLEPQMAQLVSISNSLRPTPEWSRKIAEHRGKMHDIAMRGMRERHKIHMETMDYIRDLNRQSWEYNNRVNDRAHERFNNYIRGVDIYEQEGNAYELPSHYDYVYGDGDGNFVMTNDAMYQPGVDFYGTWTQLQARQ